MIAESNNTSSPMLAVTCPLVRWSWVACATSEAAGISMGAGSAACLHGVIDAAGSGGGVC